MRCKEQSIKRLAVCLLAGFFTGCDFSDDAHCVYYGTLKADVARAHPLPLTEAPDTSAIHIVYYPITGKAVDHLRGRGERVEANPFVRDLHRGEYRFLLFQKGSNPVRGLENGLEAGEVFSDVRQTGGRNLITTRQQPLYSFHSGVMEIKTDDTTRLACRLQPLVQRLTFHFSLKGLPETFPVKTISAILDGVTTSRHLHNRKKGNAYASLPFEAEKAGDGEDGLRFRASVWVLGIDPAPDNRMDLFVDFENGMRVEVTTDLNEAFDHFTSDEKEIDVDVEILSSLTPKATITGWEDSHWGEIHLIPVVGKSNGK